MIADEVVIGSSWLRSKSLQTLDQGGPGGGCGGGEKKECHRSINPNTYSCSDSKVDLVN